MSLKHYKLALSASSLKIRKARKKLKGLSKMRKIELMVEARLMTVKQGDRAKKKLSEIIAPSNSLTVGVARRRN